MSVLSFLQSAAGGAIFGPVLGALGRFVNAKWILPAETKAEIDRLTAQRNAAADASAWAAFAASQQSEGSLSSVPANAAPWASTLLVFSEAFRKLVRPLLTLGGLPMVLWVYFTVTDPLASSAQLEMAKEINFMVFTMWGWWFGERYAAIKRKPIALVPPK